MFGEVVHRDVFGGAKFQGEVAILSGEVSPGEGAADGSDGDGRAARGQTPKADGALGADFAVRG